MGKLHPIRRAKYRLGFYSKKRHHIRATAIIILITALLVSFFFFAENRISALALDIGMAQLSAKILTDTNRIASDSLADRRLSYDSIIHSSATDSQSISAMYADLPQVNALKADVSVAVGEYLTELKKHTCTVPAGSLISKGILSARGADIPVSYLVVCTGEVEFFNDFSAVGINQTRHRLMLKVKVNATLRTAFDSRSQVIVCEIPVTEAIIAGEVPSLYLEQTD